jgi:hypothetical protein
MDDGAKRLAAELNVFNTEVIQFVEHCTDDGWKQICPSEE